MTVLARLRCRTRACWVVAAFALLFLALHLPFLASSLGDIDSVNLALGVRHFDPSLHRPHPPGYPIFIALGKMASVVLNEPHALAVWGALFGAAAAFALWRFFGALEAADARSSGADARPGAGTAVAASAVALSAPLVWLSASRPLTDITGLGAVAIAQAVLASGLARQNEPAAADSPQSANHQAVQSGRLILAGAFLSALAIGVRSQAIWLTLPLLAFVLVDRAGRGAAGALIGSAVWFAAGSLLWVIPLLVASGGPAAYIAAFRNQAAEDWGGASILATHPGLRALAWSLVDTFVRPWDSYLLGALVLLLAAAGLLVLARRGRKTLTALLCLAVPYGAFHLLFQETPHTRYAIPLVPVVAYFAVRGLRALGRWPLAIGASAIVVASLATTQPKLQAFARTGSPSAQLLTAMTNRIASGLPDPKPVLRVPQALGLAWRDERIDLDRIPTLRARQWTALIEHWEGGSLAPVWYVAEPEASGLDNRHDLAQIDPASRRLLGRYRWPFDPTNLLGGVRPSDLDWYELAPPGWMVVDGGSLTPRLAGLAAADRATSPPGGIHVLLRRRNAPVNLVVGGRNLGRDGAPDVTFTLAIDGVDLETWTVPPSPGFFVRTWNWPAGVASGPGPFASLEIRADAAGGDVSRAAAIEQFDLQPASTPILVLADGWHEREYDPARGLLWRWSSARATLQVVGGAGDCVFRLQGEAPSKYFPRPSHVSVSAGTRRLFETDVSADYDWEIPVPADALAAAGGLLTLETDQTFRPIDRGESADARALGLRVFRASVTAASAPGTAASSRTAGSSAR